MFGSAETLRRLLRPQRQDGDRRRPAGSCDRADRDEWERLVLMGFEHYPMAEAGWHVLCRHFLDHGVRIPGTPYKILLSGANRIEFDQSDGAEPELPRDWLQYLTADGSAAGCEWHFMGKRIAALKGWDTADHTETADGWVLDKPRTPAGVQSAPGGTT
jgi:hypothetical protein